MGVTIPTIETLDPKDKKVLLRVDFNAPIDPKSGKIIDDSRIRAHVPTIKELIERNNAVVIMSHQGRPGSSDFIPLDQHTKLLCKYLGIQVHFVEDVMGPEARRKIKELDKGEVLVLDNVRFVSEEIIEAPPEIHAKSYLVRRLAPLFNIYVCDAFATAHRSQPSLVGFPFVLPSCAGRVMEREVDALDKIFNPELRPKIFILGGGKVHDTLRIIEHLIKSRVADRILLTGLVAQVFMIARGINIGKANIEYLEKRGLLTLVPRARRLLLMGAPIDTPIDFKTIKDNEVTIESAGRTEGIIADVGPATIKSYSALIAEASIVVLRGPTGMMEDPRFREGTRKLIEVSLASGAYVILGGGHLSAIASEMELPLDRCHVSTGGGALLLYLAGEPLPAIEALRLSAKKFLGWES